MKSIISKISVLTSFIVICIFFPNDGNALSQTYFGEDLNPGQTVPVGGNAETARNNFLSALTAGVSTESFESFLPGATAPLALSFTGGLGTINASLSGGGFIQSGPLAGRFATSGTQFWNLDTAGAGFTIDFAMPVAAFGFFATDIGDFNGNVTLQTSNGVTTSYIVPNTLNGPSGSLLFYGIIDTDNPFSSVMFGNTAVGTDAFGFDTLTVGDTTQVQVSAVPIPAAIWMFLTALAGMGLFGWRKQRQAV